MTHVELMQIIEQMHEEELVVARTKGKEYTQVDRLDNFKRIAQEIGISPKKVLWVYLKKHLDAINHYIVEEETLSEHIFGRIMDARGYLALLRCLIHDEKNNSIVDRNLLY